VYLYFHEYNYWNLNGSRKIKCVSGFEFQPRFRSFHPNPIFQESFSLAIRVFGQKLSSINFILNLRKTINISDGYACRARNEPQDSEIYKRNLKDRRF
jgi:hypothetical protein